MGLIITDDLISIIIPVYNCKRYLDKCLESITKQTYMNLEIIIVDDGSYDGSESICDKYAIIDNRVNVFHQKNKGVSAARYFGYKKASGKYLGFVDSDDWIEPKMYEMMYHSMMENNVQIVCCDYYINYENRSEVISNVHSVIKSILTKDESFHYLIMSEYYGGYIWNKLYKKTFLDKLNSEHNLFNSDISVCEDLLMNCQYFCLSKNACYLQVPYYHYLQNYESVTKNRKFNDKIISIKDAYDRILNIYKENSIDNFEFVVYEYIKVMLNLKFRIRQAKAKIRLDFNRLDYIQFLFKSKKINLKKKIYLIVSLCFPYYTSYFKEKIYEIRIVEQRNENFYKTGGS